MQTKYLQVQQLFPHYPRNVILEDLRITRSIEWTIENILDGVLILPHHLIEEAQAEFVPQTQTQTSTVHILPTSSIQNTSDPRLDIPVADRYNFFVEFHIRELLSSSCLYYQSIIRILYMGCTRPK